MSNSSSPGDPGIQSALRALSTAGIDQKNRLLVLHTPLGLNRLVAETFEGSESIDDGGFRFELSVLSDDAHIRLKRLVGRPVRLDLQTAHSRTELRPLHGHVTCAELVASNGGLARYRLVVEPWLAFLRWRQDSYLFQDQSVFDIVEAVFADYQGQGALVPHWRWEIADRAAYPQRGITTQYRESDLDFVTRLLAEEGLYYWFEHAGGDDAALGQHVMVIADHPGAFTPGAQPSIRFHRSDATEREDSIGQWDARRQLQTNALRWQSWDYKSVSDRPGELQGTHVDSSQHRRLLWRDDPGPYAWETEAQRERLLANAVQALAMRNKFFEGQSTVRTMSPARTFTLEQHPVHDRGDASERRFAVLAVHHSARNNLDEDLERLVRDTLGGVGSVGEGAPGAADSKTSEVPHYRNRFTAIRAQVAYRPLRLDSTGRAIHAKPSAHGSQSAIVVGAQAPMQTERDHRIKVQFHWQRGSRSSMREAHPGGADNAPASESLGAWLRVGAAVAGGNWGQVAIPRVGQEVLVEFQHGDIDRPVVVGALYSGQGEPDAQHNQKQAGGSGATGNAPAWFAGQSGEHAHNAVYSGIKTQALQASQSCTGGYNQLVFDDTPAQSRLGLETTQAASRLQLGHQKGQDDNARGADRGHGAELATQAQGAIRAGAGLLVSAHVQHGAAGAFMASREAQTQTTQARELGESLTQSAQKQGAKLQGEPTPEKLAALAGLKHIGEVLGATDTGSGGGDEPNTVSAYSEPHLQLSAPQGIGIATPREAVIVSGAASAVVAGEDLGLLAQGQMAIAVADGVSFYTVGTKPTASDEPNQERGIALHAASGQVQLQSQAGASRAAADKAVSVVSTTANVAIEAPEHVLLTVAGAYVKLVGDTVQIHAPGKVTFRGWHDFVGGASTDIPGHDFPAAEIPRHPIEAEVHLLDADGNVPGSEEVRFVTADGKEQNVAIAGGKGTLEKFKGGPIHGAQEARKR